MHPVCFHIGPVTIHWYGVMMALGFVAGFGSWWCLERGRGRPFNYLSDLLFWIMLAGLVGARLAYVASDLGYFLDHPGEIVRVDRGGLIYYGGFAGAAFAIWRFAHRYGDRFWDLLDLVVPSVPLAHAFGRIGCLLNGCCFGKPWSGMPGIRYPADSHAWCAHVNAGLITRFDVSSLPVHPVQLYETSYNLLLYAVLVLVYVRRRREGIVTAVYLMAYPVGRFLLEFLRGDDRLRWHGLSAAQWISVGLLAAGLTLFYMLRRRPVPTRGGSAGN